ncbi:MAG: PD-(D/E)XK nuclease family protein [Candidatus Poseidonia sp.]|nr:PD-(D/E)XK nuclease family protein [Poseidonia sp.]
MAEKKEVSTGSAPTHPEAVKGEDGRWHASDGRPLPVSASDLERYTYCPLSWHLAATGTSGKSEAIEEGKRQHQAIHESIMDLKGHQFQTQKNLLIWQWWFSIIVILLVDTVAFRYIDDIDLNVLEFSRFLAVGALSFLLVGVMALLVPWRVTIGLNRPFLPKKEGHVDHIEPVFEPHDFMGGWFQAGLLETFMFISAIVLALHSSALLFAEDREQASFVLAFTTVGWTLLASVVLRRALKNNASAESLAQENNLNVDDEISYSDDEEKSRLLVDDETGLRGRPDQIVIIDSEFIPVEQKTGKVPKRPHDSHRLQALAYARLVEKTTGRSPPYALLRYGQDNLHQLIWDAEAEEELFAKVREVQHVMAEGGAVRNHERPGKCQHCSRRHACGSSLV